MRPGWALVAACALVAVACGRRDIPSGGPEDRFPPFVVETMPDTFATIEPGDLSIRFRFSERISERPSGGRLRDAVVVSPEVGDLRVKHRRHGLEVGAGEGFLPDRVYRVTLLPVIRDMFGNALVDPFDLVFSTGGEMIPNVVAGMVEDRVTGDAVPEVRVAARFSLEDDTLVHWNFSDTAGVFSLRYVPVGPFELWAWQDRNRDGELGEREPQSQLHPGEIREALDTALAVLTLVEPDTTPARLAKVEINDSVTLAIEIDDYIEPELAEGTIVGELVVVGFDTTGVASEADSVPEDEAPAISVELEVTDTTEEAISPDDLGEPDPVGADSLAVAAEADTVPVRAPPELGDTLALRIFQENEYEVWNERREDSIARARELEELAEADSVGAEVGEDATEGRGAGVRQRERGRVPEEPADSAPDFARTLSGLLIPHNSLVGVLEEPLAYGVLYELTLGGIVNIAGLGGGGGVDTILWEWPDVEEEDDEAEEGAEEADSVLADTLESPDSAANADGERQDTTAQESVPADTLSPDTAQATDSVTSPDTLAPREGARPPGTTDQRRGQGGAIRPSGATRAVRGANRRSGRGL